MGGTESVGHLHVQLETCNLQAGQAVTGVVHFHLQQEIEANSLSLKFSGKEHCYWSETDTTTNSDGSTSETTRSYLGKAVVVREMYPVYVFAGGKVAPGQYSFPFAFDTYPTLPGSFELKFGTAVAYIKYTVTALISSQSKVKKSKAVLHVTKLMTEAISTVHGSLAANISTWCCCSQGTVQVTGHTDKSAYVPGETAVIEAEVDNRQGRIGVMAVSGTLYRTLRLKSNEGVPFISKVRLNEVSIAQSIRVGQVLEGSSRVKLSLPIRDPRSELQNATTVCGQRIECIYTVAVTAVMDGSCMCCGQTPAVELELVIYPLQLQPLAPPLAPDNWNPMVMPVAQLHPSAPPLPTRV